MTEKSLITQEKISPGVYRGVSVETGSPLCLDRRGAGSEFAAGVEITDDEGEALPRPPRQWPRVLWGEKGGMTDRK